MNHIAHVRTRSGDPLRVRSSPNGTPVGFVSNGSQVYVTGEPVVAAGWTWVQIGVNRWVASEFLAIDSSANNKARVIATRTRETIGGGLRVYQTELIDPTGVTLKKVRGISGRVGKQTPSDVAGSATPLPFGVYTFDRPGSVEDVPGEFGNAWSAITPRFKTERSALGIHYDPSVFKQNANTGTAGCFATPTLEERNTMTAFIQTHKPTHFIVREG
ncbi:SH3 domain-containing protein [Phormidium tenue FACHB-886]|nr:SH3 domain-containing protein [Phormidium tenue FACHB-886]